MRGVFTSTNYFDVLGVRPEAGRTFQSADAATHAAVAVIRHRVWMREFGGDASAVGRSVRVGNVFVQIVGVAPPFFVGVDLKPARGDRGPDMWLPIWMADQVLPMTPAEQRRQERDLYFVGRLKDGVTLGRVQAEAAVVASRLAAGRGRAFDGNADVSRVWIGNPDHRQITVGLILPIPVLVLMIACVNAANLMLARGTQRQREIAIRLAIGAGRGRIVRQLLIESAILAVLATIAAVPIAWWGLRLASTPLNIPVAVDGTVLALSILTAAATTLAFGLAPALRTSAQRPATMLGSAGARGDTTPRQSRARRALVITQVALSLGLLATAGQLVSAVRAQARSSGTPARQLLIARFDLRPLHLPGGAAEGFYRDLAARASRLPDVEAAGLARSNSVWTFGQAGAAASILVWRPADAPDAGQTTIGGYVDGDLFRAVGLRLLAGRTFTDEERHHVQPQVAVVNQTFAKNLPGPALGSILRVAPRGRDFYSAIDVRIVGIVEPSLEPRYEDGIPAAKVYLPAPIEPEPALALYVRTRGAATNLVQPLRDLVTDLAPGVPILEIGSLEEFNERAFGPQLWLARAAVFLGVVGLLLATAGLYGVSSYVVAMRSREVAIRMAVGARPRAILWMLLGQSMRVAGVGLLLGGGAALAVSRLIQSVYYGIHSIDAAAFGGAVGLFVAAMLLASAIPAVRASRLDPVMDLKDA